MAMSPEQKRAYRARMKEAGTPIPRGGSKREAEQRRWFDRWPGHCCYLDGEAFEVDGRSDYSLLQTLDPETGEVHTTECVGQGRLHTEQCLSHLYLPEKCLTFGYGLGYDFSNWFADIPLEGVLRLYRTGRLCWRRFLLFFVPGKFLRVIDRGRPKGDMERYVYDLLPFYQQRFTAALEGAGVPVPVIIEEGKALRGEFTVARQTFVSDYNVSELRAMHDLHTSLIGILKAGDCTIRHWYGPGSMARFYAKREGVAVEDGQRSRFLAKRRQVMRIPFGDYDGWRERWNCVDAVAVDAFYGGRFEMSIHGAVPECWEYDLASAYPWAFTQGMPCFACEGAWHADKVEWEDVDVDKLTGLPRWSLLEVEWEPRNSRHRPMWGPFPYRMKRSLAWTRSGRGVYHLPEVLAAVSYLHRDYRYRVRRVVSWHPSCDHDPWEWVGRMARERVAIKHTEPGKAQCLKLALNSLYGITADKSGVDNPSKPRVPQFHNPYWAGLITARTRGRLLQAASAGGEDICYLATDGVHSRRPLDLPTGTALGDWEPPSRSAVPCVFLAPGTYKYRDDKRGKSRGIPLGTLGDCYEEWVALYERTRAEGGFEVPLRHFVSIREAANRTQRKPPEDFDTLRNTWYNATKQVSYDLTPRRERRSDGRWVAPSASEWAAQSRTLHMLGVDQATIDDEEAAYYQPE